VAGKITLRSGMEEAPENGKELSHSAHANGMNILFDIEQPVSCTVIMMEEPVARKGQSSSPCFLCSFT